MNARGVWLTLLAACAVFAVLSLSYGGWLPWVFLTGCVYCGFAAWDSTP